MSLFSWSFSDCALNVGIDVFGSLVEKGSIMRKVFLVALVGVMFSAAPVFAQEGDLGPVGGNLGNLTPGFATSLADTTTVEVGQVELGLAGGYWTNGTVFETGAVQLTYGLVDNVELIGKWGWVLGESKVDGNGDTVVGINAKLVEENDNMPSMAVEVSGRCPTGDGFTGYDGTVLGVASKTYGDLRVHVNAGYTTIGDSTSGMRSDTDYFAAGIDYPLLDNVVLVVDGVSAESAYEGEDRLQSAEAGIRTSLTDVDTLSVGVSVSVGNGNATPDFTATVGYQRAL
ncbi:MAG: hypothetical protein J7M19_03620 [Planctomycetes bacterium]|nr:hypothetical protein [Planctomycetota bacterium]